MDADTLQTASRRLAVVFGASLAVIEIFYNWGNPSWWPFIVVDYLAVALLLYGAWRSPGVLAAGWGFACAMFYMAFFLSLEAGRSGPVMLGMGAMFAATGIGLGLSLAAALQRGA